MKVIKKASTLVTKILGKQSVTSREYRLIKYLVVSKEESDILLLNTLTGQLIEIDNDCYDLLLGTVPYSSDLFDLVSDWFLVPIDFSESNLLDSIRNIYTAFDTENYYNHYTIFTTTDCNARCFYCFELGKKREYMSVKTALKTAEFIKKHAFGQEVILKWFGGEPLCNRQVIDVICRYLSENNISYYSTMVSNGYLFDDDFISNAKSLYNLRHVQITLDGTEKKYNSIKSFVNTDSTSPFKKVLKNIDKLMFAGIRVKIRLNMDNHNYDDLFSLIDYLKTYFDTVKPYIYIAPLYDRKHFGKGSRSEFEHIEIIKKVIDLEQHLVTQGFLSVGRVKENLKIHSCIADDDHSLVILPSGNVGKCDQHLDDMLIGTINSESFDSSMINEWKVRRESFDFCNVCPIAPYCKKIVNCPADNVGECLDIDREYRIFKIKNRMHYEKKIKCANESD